MANEKRLIDANELLKVLKHRVKGNEDSGIVLGTNSTLEIMEEWVRSIPTVDAVPAEQFNTLKSLVNGEWVDCKLVQEALGIDFATGLKLFDFSRTAEWNPAPLNGQKITTRFRLKNTVDAVEVVHGRWKHQYEKGMSYKVCSICGCRNGLDLKFNYCPNCGAKMDGDGNG